MDLFALFNNIPDRREYILGKIFLFFIKKVHYDVQVPIFFMNGCVKWVLLLFIVRGYFFLYKGDIIYFYHIFLYLDLLSFSIFFDGVRDLVRRHQSHEAEKFFSRMGST